MSDKKSLDFFVGNQRLITDEHIDLEIKEIYNEMLVEADKIIKDNIMLIITFQERLGFNKSRFNTIEGKFIAAEINKDMGKLMDMGLQLGVLGIKSLQEIDYRDYLKLRELYKLAKLYDIEKYKVK